MGIKKCKLLGNILIVVIAVISLSACKATATLNINVEDASAGSMSLVLELDEAAAASLRSDAFNSKTLEELFSTDTLQAAGFKVSIEDEPTKLVLSAEFRNEKELKNALSVITTADILDVTLSSKEDLIFEKTELTLNVDLNKLRADYVDNDEVRQKVIAAGIEFEDYEALINDAFSSTRVNIELAAGTESSKTAIITQEQWEKEAKLESSEVRTHFLLNIGGAILSFIAAIFVLWRIRRRSSVVSYGTGYETGSEN